MEKRLDVNDVKVGNIRGTHRKKSTFLEILSQRRGGLTQSQLFIKIDQNLICLGKCKSLKNRILLLFFNFLQRGFEQNSIN